MVNVFVGFSFALRKCKNHRMIIIFFPMRRNFTDHFTSYASFLIPKSYRAELGQECKMLAPDKSWIVWCNHATHINILAYCEGHRVY
jgi:hypothetical protein